MDRELILRLLMYTVIFAEGIAIGKYLTIRKLCLRAEKENKGTIDFIDIHGEVHTAIVEA